MLFLNCKTAIATALCALTCSVSAVAQAVIPAILKIQTDNGVRYIYDTADLSAFAAVPTPLSQIRPTFSTQLTLADVVAVNDKPAKGLFLNRAIVLNLTTDPSAGQAIADVVRTNYVDRILEILQSDGTPIGSLTMFGFDGGTPPPGAPASAAASNFAITGGTGAFLGVRGQFAAGGTPSNRNASVKEDPARRRINGGGPGLYYAYLIPMSRPEVVVTPNGPSVFHSDFTPVTAARPARAGEVLIVMATNLGPTRPGVDPGRPFPRDPLQVVNSPMDALVNGEAAEVINKIGWPGFDNVYRVDLRVPAGTAAGAATLQLSAAWIPGPPVNIPIQ